MPSPTWADGVIEPPIAAAIAAATHAAWQAPREKRIAAFAEALRKLVGAERFEAIELRALSTFQLQMDPPDNFASPPLWAWFQICPGCEKLRRTKFTRAQNGRLKLEVLRDRDWLAEQFEKGQTAAVIAAQLDCTVSLIVDWAGKHDLEMPRTRGAREFDDEVRSRHHRGEAPGTIALAMECKVQRVRRSLSKQKIATSKAGHHYFEAEWWRVRLVDRNMKVTEASREAGIRPHAGLYFVKKFGLTHISRRNRKAGRPLRYPMLHDADRLRDLLSRHSTYRSAADELGCAPSAVSRAAQELLDAPKRSYPNQLPHSRREWWIERLDEGLTTYDLAEEAGIAEKSVRERLRIWELLDRGYRKQSAARAGCPIRRGCMKTVLNPVSEPQLTLCLALGKVGIG